MNTKKIWEHNLEKNIKAKQNYEVLKCFSRSVFLNEYAMVVSKLKSMEFVILSSFEPVFIPYLNLTRHPNPTSYLPTIFLIAIQPPVTPSCLHDFLFVMFSSFIY